MSGEVPSAPLLHALTGADHATLPELLRARCQASPDRLFLTWQGRRWTYGEAWTEACCFAGWLQARGHVPGDRVAAYLGNRPECLWALFGSLIAGGIHVPLNRNHKGRLLGELIARSRAKLLVTERAALADLPPAGEGPDRLLIDEDWPTADPRVAPVAGAPSDLAILMYTSGTTGRSKAVRLPHNMFCRGGDAIATAFRLGPDDVFHLWLPLFHIAALLHAVTSTVVAGGALALYPTFSRRRFWAEVADSGATIFSGLPNVLSYLLADPGEPRHSLKVGMVAGAAPELKQAFEDRFGVTLLDTYGMTEIEPLTLPTWSDPPGSCGRAGRDFELAVVDASDRRLPLGAEGEIVARPLAPSVMMQGYEDDGEATARTWRDLWHHTGDLGRIDAEGFVYVRGRLKQMIRRGGENISAFELESLICEHPGVAEAAVVGVPSAASEEEVKAVLVAAPGVTLDPVEVRAFCSARMARFMVPRFIELVAALPRSDLGKVQVEALRGTGEGVWDALA